MAALPTLDELQGMTDEALITLQLAVAAELLRRMCKPAAPALAAASAGELLSAKLMAERVGVTESWIRSEARAGRIPKVIAGRYVRFDPVEVQRSLKERDP